MHIGLTLLWRTYSPVFGLAPTHMFVPPPTISMALSSVLFERAWVPVWVSGFVCLRYPLTVVVVFGYALSRFSFETGLDVRTGLGVLSRLCLGWL